MMDPRQQDIAERAYELYVARGGEHGRDLEDWLRAEKQLIEELNEPPEDRLSRAAVAAAYAMTIGPRPKPPRLPKLKEI